MKHLLTILIPFAAIASAAPISSGAADKAATPEKKAETKTPEPAAAAVATGKPARPEGH